MTQLSPYDPEIETIWRAVAAAGARSVAVVASRSGEGSTMIAGALARRAGLAGKPALLVDLNQVHPGVGRLLGMRAAPGEIVEMPALRIAAIPNIALENADLWREPSALTAQTDSWAEEWGLVVFDTAPILSRDEETIPATTVASVADASIMVTLAGRTSVSTIREARGRLAVAGAKLIGTVLNDRDNPSLLTELERETYRLAPVMPRAMAALRGHFRRSTLLTVRI